MDAIALLTTPVLTKGIKFLCEQAKELLLRRRKAQDGGTVPDTSVAATGQKARHVTVPSAFTGSLNTASYDRQLLHRAAPELLRLRSWLDNYGEEILPVNPQDSTLLGEVDRLRRLLEAIYGQHITFAGEARPASGTRLEAVADARIVTGEVTEAEIDCTRGGNVWTGATAGHVTPASKTVGARVWDLGAC